MERYNIYYRRDGRYEGRISRGKNKNGKRKYQYFFGKTRVEVEKKYLKHDKMKNRRDIASKQCQSFFMNGISLSNIVSRNPRLQII